ncbi:hypothetical protein AAFF_G00023790 [Aldrovandia affinis]|uniref:Uncharacterized protein n=1 Tax=Aldrovandia affinis TaxID=143900 RepID=A0AAD7T5R9_9TELE|nr:hypothetical protein AAFF_G00023790 [Aldrovandia affinis]
MGVEDWESKYKVPGNVPDDYFDPEEEQWEDDGDKKRANVPSERKGSRFYQTVDCDALSPDMSPDDTMDSQRKKKYHNHGIGSRDVRLVYKEAGSFEDEISPPEISFIPSAQYLCQQREEQVLQQVTRTEEQEEMRTSYHHSCKDGLIYKTRMWVKNKLKSTLEDYAAFQEQEAAREVEEARVWAGTEYDSSGSDKLQYSMGSEDELDQEAYIVDSAFPVNESYYSQSHYASHYAGYVERSEVYRDNKNFLGKAGDKDPEDALSQLEEPSYENVDPMDELQNLVESVSEYLAEKEEEISKYEPLPKVNKSKLSPQGSLKPEPGKEDQSKEDNLAEGKDHVLAEPAMTGVKNAVTSLFSSLTEKVGSGSKQLSTSVSQKLVSNLPSDGKEPTLPVESGISKILSFVPKTTGTTPVAVVPPASQESPTEKTFSLQSLLPFQSSKPSRPQGSEEEAKPAGAEVQSSGSAFRKGDQIMNMSLGRFSQMFEESILAQKEQPVDFTMYKLKKVQLEMGQMYQANTTNCEPLLEAADLTAKMQRTHGGPYWKNQGLKELSAQTVSVSLSYATTTYTSPGLYSQCRPQQRQPQVPEIRIGYVDEWSAELEKKMHSAEEQLSQPIQKISSIFSTIVLSHLLFKEDLLLEDPLSWEQLALKNHQPPPKTQPKPRETIPPGQATGQRIGGPQKPPEPDKSVLDSSVEVFSGFMSGFKMFSGPSAPSKPTTSSFFSAPQSSFFKSSPSPVPQPQQKSSFFNLPTSLPTDSLKAAQESLPAEETVEKKDISLQEEVVHEEPGLVTGEAKGEGLAKAQPPLEGVQGTPSAGKPQSAVEPPPTKSMFEIAGLSANSFGFMSVAADSGKPFGSLFSSPPTVRKGPQALPTEDRGLLSGFKSFSVSLFQEEKPASAKEEPMVALALSKKLGFPWQTPDMLKPQSPPTVVPQSKGIDIKPLDLKADNTFSETKPDQPTPDSDETEGADSSGDDEPREGSLGKSQSLDKSKENIGVHKQASVDLIEDKTLPESVVKPKEPTFLPETDELKPQASKEKNSLVEPLPLADSKAGLLQDKQSPVDSSHFGSSGNLSQASSQLSSELEERRDPDSYHSYHSSSSYRPANGHTPTWEGEEEGLDEKAPLQDIPQIAPTQSPEPQEKKTEKLSSFLDDGPPLFSPSRLRWLKAINKVRVQLQEAVLVRTNAERAASLQSNSALQFLTT